MIDDYETVDEALRRVGFEVLETRDHAVQSGPSIPWFQPLAGFRSSKVGRWVTHNSLKVLEALRVAPQGAGRVAQTLELCANGMAAAGLLGIFTPMHFIHARKPE